MSWKNTKLLNDADLEAYWVQSEEEDDGEDLNFDPESGSDSEGQIFEEENHLIAENELASNDYTEEHSNPPVNLPSEGGCTETTSEEPRTKKTKKNNTEAIHWETKYDYRPKKHSFNNEQPGCSNQVNDIEAVDCFVLFFDDSLMTKIAEQINLFYRQNRGEQAANHVKKWRDVSVAELYCFLAISLLMPQVKKLKITDYWSKDALLETPIFGQIFSRDRYLLILRNLHFVDNTDERNEEDNLWKIRMVSTHLQNSFTNIFYPFENVCIDESLMLFKGRLSFKQYIPSKRHRFGVKFFVLCDCETGYILKFIIYCGTGTDIKQEADDVGISGNIVLTLMEKYMNAGHTLYTDNWYTSPNLYNLFWSQKTNACGTVKKNRKNMPQLKTKLNKGDIEFKTSNNLLALKWQDKREVNMLSAFHTSDMDVIEKIDHKTKENISKPKVIIDYNANMGAVDRTDMLQSSIESVRKSVKWYKKVFFHLLDMSLLNAHAVYKMKICNIADFQLLLVKQILARFHVDTPRPSSRRTANEDSPLRLTGRHFLSHLPKDDKNKQTRKRCVVCSKKKVRRETTYQCQLCNVPLCAIPCFECYHTKKVYWA